MTREELKAKIREKKIKRAFKIMRFRSLKNFFIWLTGALMSFVIFFLTVVVAVGVVPVGTYTGGESDAVVGKDTKYDSRSTGELQAALGISPVGVDKKGNYDIKIGFDEPRKQQSTAKGKRSYNTATNAMIANVLEYGKHGQPAKPFLKPAQRSSQKPAKAKIIEVLESEVSKL